MTHGDWLACLRALPFGTLEALTGGACFLVVAPHPDDETLGCGGLIAAAVASGIRPQVLILTDGSGSHPGSTLYRSERLVALRREEARGATAALGLTLDELHFLNLKDAATPTAGPEFDRSVAAILALAERVRARSLFVTWGGDPHCDHEAAFAMARQAARQAQLGLWAYPIWSLDADPAAATTQAPPEGLRLDIAAQQVVKAGALRCYTSQMTGLIDDDPDGFCFTPEQLAPFLGDTETFLRIDP